MNPIGETPFGWRRLLFAIVAMLILHLHPARAADLVLEEIKLPALRIQGQAARAHTQGMELVGGKYFVTARRDDVLPKRALLLRTDPTRTDWDAWDITPVDAEGFVTALDHPGGMQSDGMRLWIPLAESKRNGRSIIRAFQLTNLVSGKSIQSDFEFPVDDHIGAVAVSVERGLLFGANWDTEKVYVWNLKGRLERTFSGNELKTRGLGFVSGAEGRAGVTVQDWKIVGDRLFASGLHRSSVPGTASPASRLCWFDRILQDDFRRAAVTLPRQEGTELSREAMTVAGGAAYFLPEDLGASNRLFRVSLAELTKRSTAEQPHAAQEP